MVANSTQNASCDIVGPFDFLAPVNAEQLLSELPEDPQQLVELGKRCLRERLVLEAEQCFTKALAVDSSLTVVHYWLGYLYSRQGQYEQAALELRKCLAAQPRNGHAYAELGLAYFKLGHIREARALWQQGLVLASSSDKSLTELLQHMSFCVNIDGEDKVVPNLCYMATLVAEKDASLAHSYLERAYALDPFNPTIFVAFAMVFSVVGQDNKASKAWEEAVRLCPRDPDLQAKLAEHYIRLGKSEEAKKWAEKVVELAPKKAVFRLLLARAEKCLGNIEIAEQHLKEAHRLEPEQADINFELGHLLWCYSKSPTAFCFLGKAARAEHKEARAFLASINIKKKLFSRDNKEGIVVEQTAY
ncbi:MAG TPA: tetratricopeptide repeat protein [Firmicutes bacterium]|nr:tetratricopeptide repeat protein [Bacillota bacterium]